MYIKIIGENLIYSKNKFTKLIFLLFILASNLKIKSNSKNEMFISNISSFKNYNISNDSSLLNKEYIISNLTFKNNNKSYNNSIQFNKKYKFRSFNDLINQLNKDSNIRQEKYLIFFDFYTNPYCNDINSYLLFEYYIKNNETNAYYVINTGTDLYKELYKKNKTKNLIPIHSYINLFQVIYPYLLNSKILVNSYIDLNMQKIISKVNYLKYLFLTHAIGYFKTKIISEQFIYLNEDKRNIIVSSPYEYDFYKKKLKYRDKYMHKAGLPRYDKLNLIQKNISENNCILISFTYRKYPNIIYNKSLFKKNLEILLNNTSLISFLKSKNIDLIYIQHHFDFLRKRPFNPIFFPYVKYRSQAFLSHYIQQCSLFITDFSTISFDFMFLNKPVLFYLIDLKDNINFEEKEYMKFDKTKDLYFENAFTEQETLIEKLKDYVINDFKLKDELKKKYNSMFFYKTNITERIVQIINNLTNKI